MTEFRETSREALAAVDRYLAALNARDTVAIRDALNFPHFRVRADGEVVRYETPKDYDFQSFFSRTGPDGWDHTKWDSTEVVFASEGKAHVAVNFTRYRADRSVIGHYFSLYIVTDTGVFRSAAANGLALWTEKALVRETEGARYWNGSNAGWLEVGLYPSIPGARLLRKVSIDNPCNPNALEWKKKCDATANEVCLLETFVRDDLAEQVHKRNFEMRFRWTKFKCDSNYPLRLHGETDTEFSIRVGPIISAASD